jgi:hypothetical protein
MRNWVVAVAIAACVLLEVVHPVLTREPLPWHDPDLALLDGRFGAEPASSVPIDFHFALFDSDEAQSLSSRLHAAHPAATPARHRATVAPPRCLNQQASERC